MIKMKLKNKSDLFVRLCSWPGLLEDYCSSRPTTGIASRSLSRGLKGFLSLYRLNTASSSSSSLRDEIIFDKSFFKEKKESSTKGYMCVYFGRSLKLVDTH